MQTKDYTVNLRYTRQELLVLFALANAEDVDKGGRYDARAAAINIWTHHWLDPTTRHDSDLFGTLYFTWADENCLWKIEAEAGFDLADMLKELGELEVKALGHVKHGRLPLKS